MDSGLRNSLQSDHLPVIGSPDDLRMFTLSEAEKLLPVIVKITRLAADTLTPLQRSLRIYPEGSPESQLARNNYSVQVKTWLQKMNRLGLSVQGLWQVEFDTGDGFFCWRRPETRLGFFRTYDETFQNRRPLEQVIRERFPDWA